MTKDKNDISSICSKIAVLVHLAQQHIHSAMGVKYVSNYYGGGKLKKAPESEDSKVIDTIRAWEDIDIAADLGGAPIIWELLYKAADAIPSHLQPIGHDSAEMVLHYLNDVDDICKIGCGKNPMIHG